MTIDVSEINQVAADLATSGLRAPLLATRAVTKTANDIAATAQGLVPVDTSATKQSIHATVEAGSGEGFTGIAAEIGPTTEYAPHLEFGTVNMAPHAFMGPALDRHAPDFVRAMEQIPDL